MRETNIEKRQFKRPKTHLRWNSIKNWLANPLYSEPYAGPLLVLWNILKLTIFNERSNSKQTEYNLNLESTARICSISNG